MSEPHAALAKKFMVQHHEKNELGRSPWWQSLPGCLISYGCLNVVDVLQPLQGVFEEVHQAVQHSSRILREGAVLAALSCLLCQLCQA